MGYIATTKDELIDLLNKPEISEIILNMADTKKLSIPKGDYSNKKLIINSSKMDIKNYGPLN